MFIAIMLAATLAGNEGVSAPLPEDIPANAVVYNREEAQKMRMRVGYYPPKASKAHADGSALVDCQVQADGTLSRCVVLKETPSDMDFGKATALLFLKYARLSAEDMKTQPVGGWKKFEYIWKYIPIADR
jgi:hypothetical protein